MHRFHLTALVLEELMAYCRAFSRNIGYVFHDGSIRLTALTGTAATEIKGETTAREFKLMNKKYTATNEIQCEFKDTRLCVVDEVSFADYDQVLGVLNERLRAFTQCSTRTYGTMPIAFLGDFCQLECIGGNTIFSHNHGCYWEQALTSMVELKGTHRYSKCEQLKMIMPRLRNQGMWKEAFDIFNSRVVDGKNVKLPNIAETKFATYHNTNRCDLNDTVFLQYLKEHHEGCNESNIPKTGIVIKASTFWTRSKQPLSFDQRKVLFENCRDSEVQDASNRHCDPMLTLFTGCQMMGTSNDDVRNGIANGTTSTLEKVVIKPGIQPRPMKLHGYWIYSVDAKDVDHVLMKWHESRFQGRFILKPNSGAFITKFPIVEDGCKMKVKTSITYFQLPLLVNHATTGHKLQGKSMDTLIVAEWSKTKNWAYVVLSRVRSLAGLYLLNPIPADINFTPDYCYLEMMKRLEPKRRSPNDTGVAELHQSFVFPCSNVTQNKP